MGQAQSGQGGTPGEGGEKKKEEKKKYEPPPPPRTGGKKKKKGPESNARLPAVTPNTKCRLRLLKLERVKDYLLMEEEFIQNQERLKPQVCSETHPCRRSCVLDSPQSVPTPATNIPVRAASTSAGPRGAWPRLRAVPLGIPLER
jgi:26S proteasome regulatory subunit T2